MTAEQLERLRYHIANVRSWHPNPPPHDCPSRTYSELADAVEHFIAQGEKGKPL